MEQVVPPDSLTPPAGPVSTLERAAEGPSSRARDEARAGLYVHVPFCATRCTYCDFATGTLTRERLERYMAGIESEMRLRAPAARGVTFTSVFFGGGTPSVLPSRHFRRISALLREHFDVARDAEITLEANPESVREPLLDAWSSSGVNRVSMGVQSFDDAELRTLGRIHDAKRPKDAMQLLRSHGFRRVSLDLMFGYPGSGSDRLRRTLDTALSLEPDHLSSYCFVPERRTPLGRAVLRGRAPLPRTAEQADMYEHLVLRLAAHGYGCYETSNFCRANEEARHNLVYWLRRPYVGLGPSAHGHLGGVRYGNRRSIDGWSRPLLDAHASDAGVPREVEASREQETAASAAEEILMLGLRLATGLDERDYAPDAWRNFRSLYAAALDDGLAQGRLERTRAGVRVPERHRFVADDTIAWLGARAGVLGPRPAPSGDS
jgi:oxygen-independent coproporphyrinogen-3 oxidase